MEKLKLLIIIMIILVIMLIGAMVVISVQTGKTENKITINDIGNSNIIGNNITNNEIFVNETTVEEIPQLSFNTEIQEITNNSILYALTNNISKYFNYIKTGSTLAVNELGGNNTYSIKNNIKFIVKQAYVTKNENQNKYYINGTLTVANGDFTSKEQEIYMIMYVDLQNNTYKLETITKEQFENKLELKKDDDIEIPKGTYNNFEYEYVDSVKQIEIYLEDYIFQIFNNTENAYNLLNHKIL